MAKIFALNGKELTTQEIAEWGNVIHHQAGGKGNPFSAEDYEPYNPKSRLSGDMCNCGTDSSGISLGEFKLLPATDPSVKDGGKAYMICKNCGCYSHL